MSIAKDAKDFLSEPFNRLLVLALLLLGITLIFQSPVDAGDFQVTEQIQAGRNATVSVHFFYSSTCPHCKAQMPFNEKLVKKYPDIVIIPHSTENPDEVRLMEKMSMERGDDGLGVPKTFVGNRTITGFDNENGIGLQIMRAIEDELAGKDAGPQQKNTLIINVPFIGEIDPLNYSLPVLAVVLGLVDGFNPCAMWVLVYLIGLVLNLNDKRKIWFIVGTFVAASGILYFLFMTAWLNAFLFLGYMRAVTIIIGLVALGGGTLSIREYLLTKGDLACKVGDADDKKKTMSRMDHIVSGPMTFATIGAIIILAFVVNSVEFVCSAAIPAVFTQVLALSNLSFIEYYGYIGLYVMFFMLDDLVVFGLAAFAVSGGIGEKYAKYCKIIGGVILFILGLLLLFAPQALR